MLHRICVSAFPSPEHVESCLRDLPICNHSWTVFGQIIAGTGVVVEFQDGFRRTGRQDAVSKEKVSYQEAGRQIGSSLAG